MLLLDVLYRPCCTQTKFPPPFSAPSLSPFCSCSLLPRVLPRSLPPLFVLWQPSTRGTRSLKRRSRSPIALPKRCPVLA
eukprot:1119409-Rhodomonas_salina.1